MRFVPIKSLEQQSLLCVHRLREGIKADRTACINRIRALLLEFGLAVATGVRRCRRRSTTSWKTPATNSTLWPA